MPIYDISKSNCKFTYTYEFRKRDPAICNFEEEIKKIEEGKLPSEKVMNEIRTKGTKNSENEGPENVNCYTLTKEDIVMLLIENKSNKKYKAKFTFELDNMSSN